VTGVPTRPSFLDTRFDIVGRSRPFALVAPGLETVSAAATAGFALSDAGPDAPYASVVLRGVSPHQPLAAGLAGLDGTSVLARWSAPRLTLEVRRGGGGTVLGRSTPALDGRPIGLAFTLCENRATAMLDTGTGWQPVLTERRHLARLVDLRREDVLRTLRYAWLAGDGVVEAGPFGAVGLRDPHLVQHADGSAFVRDGRLFLTWSCAGTGGFAQGHWSVWSFDPADPAAMRPESRLYFRRDGLVLGDHAGHLVRHEERWLVVVSSWGDFSPGRIHLRHLDTKSDLLSGVHVLDSEPALMPTTYGAWDPALARVGDRWHLAFTESPSQRPFTFHPALASTAATDWSDGLSLVAVESARRQCEGTVLVRDADATWLVASDRDHRCYPVFDLGGDYVGRLDAPYLSNIPHPTLVPDPAGGWWLVTFDGTPWNRPVFGHGTHGDVVVMHST
jgi:hypothetical protein